MSIEQRISEIRLKIGKLCDEFGRPRESVSLIAVSKRHPLQSIAAAHALGQLHFGENFAQELRDKSRALPESLKWHFMGRIQKNKAKYIAPACFRVHGLETVDQAQALANRATAPLSCLVAVNIGREEQKSGVLPKELRERVRALSAVQRIQIRGLMCLPPYREDPEDTAQYFNEMAQLLCALQADGFNMDELSMGMSHDYHVALRYGATWLRIGTAIFGPRGG
jgi:pyridoxal phosphate enzyme (YggS family)